MGEWNMDKWDAAVARNPGDDDAALDDYLREMERDAEGEYPVVWQTWGRFLLVAVVQIACAATGGLGAYWLLNPWLPDLVGDLINAFSGP